jgi:serine protease AprX
MRAVMSENKARVSEQITADKTIVANMSLSAISELSQSGTVNYISPDRSTKSFGYVEKSMGLDLVRTQPTFTLNGTGVGIAVIDSGVTPTHNAFKDANGASRVVFSKSFVEGDASTNDVFGHGTHVAGLAAGNPLVNSGAYKGVATNSKIINLRVLDAQGKGRTSWLLNALEWIRLNHQTYNIKVVNLSLGSPAIDAYYNDPVTNKVYELTCLGITVVAAAGNHGKNESGQKVYGQIHAPGNEPSAITVGASNGFGTPARC